MNAGLQARRPKRRAPVIGRRPAPPVHGIGGRTWSTASLDAGADSGRVDGVNEVPPQPRTDGCHGGRHGQRSSQAVENARAAREAREAVVHGAHPRDPLAVDAALRRYLAAEQYAREHHPDDRAKDDTEATGDLIAEDETPT